MSKYLLYILVSVFIEKLIYARKSFKVYISIDNKKEVFHPSQITYPQINLLKFLLYFSK